MAGGDCRSVFPPTSARLEPCPEQEAEVKVCAYCKANALARGCVVSLRIFSRSSVSHDAEPQFDSVMCLAGQTVDARAVGKSHTGTVRPLL